jgi:hypothetical protein
MNEEKIKKDFEITQKLVQNQTKAEHGAFFKQGFNSTH